MTQADAGAGCPEAPAPSGEHERIDLDRVVWDPEYRHQVRENMRTAG